uniref:Uncharacterized protein n=1 Tax=Periophthalmus magnuspinnatus TaxID=409849 RepID=A0A3B4A333_9GOBI
MPMYQVKPVCGGHIEVDLPTCMYKLPNIHAQDGNGSVSDHALQNGEVDPAVKALEARQDEIMRKLYELKAAVEGLAKTVTTPDADLDLTVSSSLCSQSPTNTAFQSPADLESLLGKVNSISSQLTSSCGHTHLNNVIKVTNSQHCIRVPSQLLSCLGPRHADSYARQLFQLGFTLIWKNVPKLQMKFSIQNMCSIEGEANVARFLFKLLSVYPSDPALATLVDSWVDTAFFQLAEGGPKERATVLRALNSALGRTPWVAGSDFSLADIACFCCMQKCISASSAPANVQRWLKSCENLGHFSPAKLFQ